jgi:hypothetical protein
MCGGNSDAAQLVNFLVGLGLARFYALPRSQGWQWKVDTDASSVL